MKNALFFLLALGCLLHWHQAYQRCLTADQRLRSTLRELEVTEAALKEWPQLQLQATHARPPDYQEPQQLSHPKSLRITFQPGERSGPPQYRVTLGGPRPAIMAELLALTERFWLESVELRSPSGDQVEGEAVLRAVP